MGYYERTLFSMEEENMKKTATLSGTNYSCLIGGALCIVFAIALIIGLPVTDAAGKVSDGGILQQGIESRQDVISVKLLGVTKYELTEMFNDLLVKAPGVVEAKRYRLRLEPDNPGACIVEWQVRLEGADAFQLEIKLYKMVRNLANSRTDVHTQALTFKPTAEDLAFLKDIRPWQASTKELQFVLKRSSCVVPLCESLPFASSTNWNVWPNAGFE